MLSSSFPFLLLDQQQQGTDNLLNETQAQQTHALSSYPPGSFLPTFDEN